MPKESSVVCVRMSLWAGLGRTVPWVGHEESGANVKSVNLIQALCFLGGVIAHSAIAVLTFRNRPRRREETAFGVLTVCFGVILLGHLVRPITGALGIKADAGLKAIATLVGSSGLCALPAVLAYWLYTGVVKERVRRMAAALIGVTATVGVILFSVEVVWLADSRVLTALRIGYNRNWLLVDILCTILLVSAMSWMDGVRVGGQYITQRINAMTVLAVAFFLGAALASSLARSPEIRMHAATALYSMTVLLAGVIAYHTYRFPFVDIVIKRGAAVALAATLLTLWYVWVLAPVGSKLPADPALLRPIATGLLLLPIVGVLPGMCRWLNRSVDCAIFGRYDRAAAATELAAVFASASAEKELVSTTIATLCGQLGISSAEFLARDAQDATRQWTGFENPFKPPERSDGRRGDQIAAPVAAGELRFGTLVCGARISGLPYLSEDVHFMRWVGDSLGTALQRIEAQGREQQLRDMAIQAQITALRAQINPHFLFNALNAVASLIRIDPPKAEHTVERLATIFNYALGSSERSWMTLGEELNFIETYLQIEKTRFEEKLTFEIDCPRYLSGCLIPPMILQPLVENAIKHGIGKKLEGGRVGIEVRKKDDWIEIQIGDTGPGFKENARNGRGHGLRNVTERLAKTYEGRYRFNVASEAGSGCVITIELPAASAAASLSAAGRAQNG